MLLTAADWLAVLEPRLTGPLFACEALGRLRSLALDLPGECQGTLEVRLAPPATTVDLSLRVLTAAQARMTAARFPSSPVQRLLSQWSEPGGPLAPVRSIWLEFDLEREPPAGTLPVPIVCAKLPQEADSGWLTGTLLPALAGRPPSTRQRGLILTCLEALPASASLLYVFSLRARGSNAVRLEIFGMNLGEIRDYLLGVAPRMIPAVAKVAPLFEDVERLHLSFDLDEVVLPRFGLEGSFPRQPLREPRWEDLFTRLVNEGLCSAEKRDAVLAWPGYDTFWTAPERWPVAEIGPRGFCVRGLSHVKLVCRPEREPEAKAYLVFGPFESSSDSRALREAEGQSQLARHS